MSQYLNSIKDILNKQTSKSKNHVIFKNIA